jgi:hypothetical protein
MLVLMLAKFAFGNYRLALSHQDVQMARNRVTMASKIGI